MCQAGSGGNGLAERIASLTAELTRGYLHMRLSQHTVLITGGTSGIGAATVRLFVKEGAQVTFTGRRIDQGQALATETGAIFVPADHATLEGCEQAFRSAAARMGKISTLFNNAGFVPKGRAEDTSEEVWAETMNLNVTSVWRMSKLAVPHMRQHGGGVIVNNASDFALVGGRKYAAYCASKGAVVQLTRAMALDHALDGIRVNAVCPGDTQVERWAAQGDAADLKAMLQRRAADLPIGRVGTPEEIAKAVLFLASPDSSFMTGNVLVVDGGNTAQ
jgi:NAD(P)-dependent dehydrogenase (short-subunit alcohol dehydrogenase family)